MSKLPLVVCLALVVLGLWMTGVALSTPLPEIPGGAAHAVSTPQNPQSARAALGLAMVAGGGLGAWIFARR